MTIMIIIQIRIQTVLIGGIAGTLWTVKIIRLCCYSAEFNYRRIFVLVRLCNTVTGISNAL